MGRWQGNIEEGKKSKWRVVVIVFAIVGRSYLLCLLFDLVVDGRVRGVSDRHYHCLLHL